MLGASGAAMVFGNELLFFAIAGAVYVTWHMVNIVRLRFWLDRGRFRTPLSLGLWEAIFDDLQAVQLRNRRRKRALLALVRQLRELAANIPDAVVLLDKRSQVRWFNPAAEHLLGLRWPRDSLRSLPDFLHHPILKDQLDAGGATRPVEAPSPINGAVMLLVEISAIGGTEQRLLVARDITKIYNLERSRREFVANVSHELRTPITVFRGYLEVLEDLVKGNPKLERPVTLLDEQSNRMHDLVEDLLGLSRLEFIDLPPAVEPVQVSQLLQTITDETQGLKEARDHQIEIDADPDLWLAADESILRATFSNLIVNALKHTPAGTQVRVKWGREDGDCVMRVSDNGPGIAAYHLPRLTERFYRVDSGRNREKGRTGLGLAIAKHAVERHGGALKIASTPGKGSDFTCQFPDSAVVSSSDSRNGKLTRPHV